MKNTKDSNQGMKAAGAAGACAIAGAFIPTVIGGMGLTVGGSAVAIGIAPLAIAGAFVGLAGYGLYRVFR